MENFLNTTFYSSYRRQIILVEDTCGMEPFVFFNKQLCTSRSNMQFQVYYKVMQHLAVKGFHITPQKSPKHL